MNLMTLLVYLGAQFFFSFPYMTFKILGLAVVSRNQYRDNSTHAIIVRGKRRYEINKEEIEIENSYVNGNRKTILI